MAIISIRVSNDYDDGYKWPPSSWYTNGVEVGKTYGGDAVNFAVRFRNVTIPAGSTIVSAKLTVKTWYNQSRNLVSKISGIDEDNTADFSSDPMSRAETTAKVDWDQSADFLTDVAYDSAGISSIVQEIIDRGGWASGNAMGFFIKDDGSSPNDGQNYFYDYNRDTSKCTLLTVEYTEPIHQIYKTLSYKVRKAVSPIEKTLKYCIADKEDTPVEFTGIKVAKDGRNALNTDNPHHLKFSSDYNTLKYFMNGSGSIHVVEDPMTEYADYGYITHGLGYFPFAIIYAKDDLMSGYQPLGRFQAGSGAYRQFYYYITSTRIYFVAKGWSGEDGEDYTVNFYYKVFKNNLNL